MKLLERRKPFRPKAAARTPRTINRALSDSRRTAEFYVLLADDAAGDAIARVAGRVGLQVVDAGVHDQRRFDAHPHVRREDGRLGGTVLENGEVVHVAGVRSLGILQSVFLAIWVVVAAGRCERRTFTARRLVEMNRVAARRQVLEIERERDTTVLRREDRGAHGLTLAIFQLDGCGALLRGDVEDAESTNKDNRGNESVHTRLCRVVTTLSPQPT